MMILALVRLQYSLQSFYPKSYFILFAKVLEWFAVKRVMHPFINLKMTCDWSVIFLPLLISGLSKCSHETSERRAFDHLLFLLAKTERKICMIYSHIALKQSLSFADVTSGSILRPFGNGKLIIKGQRAWKHLQKHCFYFTSDCMILLRGNKARMWSILTFYGAVFTHINASAFIET